MKGGWFKKLFKMDQRTDKEKVESLDKEIEELRESKEDKDKLKEKLDERNRLKFTKLYSFGGMMKNMGKSLAAWADEKNKEEEAKKKEQTESKEEKPVDVYEQLFGADTDLKLDLGI